MSWFGRRMKAIAVAVLALSFGGTPEVLFGQGNPALFVTPTCKGDFPSEKAVCEAVLPRSVDTRNNKVGDHILLRIALFTGPAGQPITTLDATIVEIRPRGPGSSFLRVRIEKAVRRNGQELPVEATVVAIASQSVVTDRVDYPAVISDRFPHIPEDDERLPGERKLSEDQRPASPLDAMPDFPVAHKAVCDKKAKKTSGNPCIGLLQARGIYGFKKVTLEPADRTSPAESVLNSKNNMRFPSGTLLVLQVQGIHRAVP